MHIQALLVAGLAAMATQVLAQAPPGQAAPGAVPHNVVIFVADGLRSRAVNDHTAPNMAALARQGVHLVNSHSVFPTFTMANASAIATGHQLGDTGVFSNTIYVAHPVPGAANSPVACTVSGPAAEVGERFPEPVKGEITLVIGAGEPPSVDVSDAVAAVAELVAAGASRRTAADVVARITGASRNALYRRSL